IDTYYDAADYRLTTKDWLLRYRDGRWEIKIAEHDRGHGKRAVDQYKEIENEEGIRQAIGLEVRADFLSDLTTAGYKPFITVKTTRRKYHKENFTIDIDSMDFGYEICEIERMAEDGVDADKLAEQILAFSAQHGLEHASVRGKVVEYLYRFAPEHYKALGDAGVL
ncbi:MAG: CYTH domain-containing protein, partial [Patescibacteria group bacterium]